MRIPISPIQRVVDPGASGGPALARTPQVDGLAQVGQALQGVTDQFARSQLMQTERAMQLEHEQMRARVLERARSDRLRWTEQLQALQSEAPAGAEGFTPSVLNKFDAYREQALKGITDQTERTMYDGMLGGLRETVGEHALVFQAGSRRDFRKNSLTNGLDTSARTVAIDPSQFTDVLATELANIQGASELDAPTKAALADHARSTLSFTAAKTMVRRDPLSVLQRLGYEYHAPTAPDAATPDPGGWKIPPEVQAARDAERLQILIRESTDPNVPADARDAVKREIALVEAKMKAAPKPKAAAANKPTPGTNPAQVANALKTDPILGNLKPEHIDTIAAHALAAVQQMDAQARAAMAARQQEGAKLAQGIISAWDNGYQQDPAIVQQAKDATRGTPAFVDLLNAEQRAQQGQQFRLMPPAQQQDILLATRSQATTPETAVQHEKLNAIHNDAVEKLKRDPMAYGAQVLNMPLAAVDWSSPDRVAATLPARVEQSKVVAAKFGVPVPAVTEHEAKAWADKLDGLGAAHVAVEVSSMARAMDPASRGVLADAVAPKDNAVALALRYGGDQRGDGTLVSQLILQGRQNLKDKIIKVDQGADVGWRANIVRAIGDAYPDEKTRRDAVDAAYYITAGISQGTVATSSDINRAVALATGGIIEHNGRKVPLPYGMEEGAFLQRLRDISPLDIKSQAPDGKVYSGGQPIMNAEQFTAALPDAQLIIAGPGRYNVRSGERLITNSLGKRITIEIGNVP